MSLLTIAADVSIGIVAVEVLFLLAYYLFMKFYMSKV